MKLKILFDVLVNILLPIVAGYIIYQAGDKSELKNIKNYLPDGLWAYAFVSCILVIWNRRIKGIWLVTTLAAFVIFEVLQYFKLVEGTADILDVFIYFCFAGLALFVNRYCKIFYQL